MASPAAFPPSNRAQLSLMAHRVSPQAEADLDDIWYYVAKESTRIETANHLIDSITDRRSLRIIYADGP